MKNKWILVVALMAFIATVEAASFTGRVVGVTDGDTITLLMPGNIQEQVRLGGIDAPEKRQPFGQVAKTSLSDLVFGQTVVVEANKRDRYKRLIGKVQLDGVDINLVQIERGMAWHYKTYQRDQEKADRTLYDEAEQRARARREGLWRDEWPTPPWEFRKAIKESRQAQ